MDGTRPVARVWFGVAALVAAVSLIVRLGLTWTEDEDTLATRLVRFASYFTIQSNLLVAVSLGALALGLGVGSRRLATVRLAATMGIAVTLLVYQTVLRGTSDLQGLEVWTSRGFHTVVPAMAVSGWLLFGPRPRWTAAMLRAAIAWPVLWLGWTLAHGAVTDWYPYPFLDVVDLGYARALLDCLAVAALMVAVGYGLLRLDRALPPADEPARAQRSPELHDHGGGAAAA